MTKVKGPLFSLAASGTFKNEMEFRTGNGKTIVTSTRKVKPPRSEAQLAQAEKFGRSITAWQGLSPEVKAAWKAEGVMAKLTGYQLFISEYASQNIQPPSLPVIP